MFTLTLGTEGGTFADGGFETEVASILHRIAHRVAQGEQSGNIRDSAGNIVGQYAYHLDDSDRPSII